MEGVQQETINCELGLLLQIIVLSGQDGAIIPYPTFGLAHQRTGQDEDHLGPQTCGILQKH